MIIRIGFQSRSNFEVLQSHTAKGSLRTVFNGRQTLIISTRPFRSWSRSVSSLMTRSKRASAPAGVKSECTASAGALFSALLFSSSALLRTRCAKTTVLVAPVLIDRGQHLVHTSWYPSLVLTASSPAPPWQVSQCSPPLPRSGRPSTLEPLAWCIETHSQTGKSRPLDHGC